VKTLPQNDFYLLNLSLTLVGVICFFINVKGLIIIPGLLLISILLMLTPVLLIALNWHSCELSRVQSLSLVILPIIFLNYTYYIKMGLPVGFQDVHNHIFQYTQLFGENGKILFFNAQGISYNFVGLYIIFRFLTQICHVNIITLSSLIPPLFNVIIIATIYVIVNRLHSHRVALIATVFYGWEGQVLVFGQEMRTQTIGTVLLFSLIASFLIFQKSTIKKSPYAAAALIIFLFSIVTISFVSIFYTSLLLCAMLLTVAILPALSKWPKEFIYVTWSLFGLFFIFFCCYLLYIGISFQNILLTIVELFNEMTLQSRISYGPPLYGIFVKFVIRAFWLAFLVFAGFYAIDIFKKKDLIRATFFASFGILLLFGFIDAFIGPLSYTRVYIIAFILMATVVSFGFLKMLSCTKKSSIKYASKAFVCTMIILFAASSVAQIPNYVVGETSPIRSIEPIDSVPYWDTDLPQYATGIFLYSSAIDQSIHPHMLIRNYFFLQVCKTNRLVFKKSLDFKGNFMPNKIRPDELIVVHDKFNGQDYTYRELLPDLHSYHHFAKIYSNFDYLVYKS